MKKTRKRFYLLTALILIFAVASVAFGAASGTGEAETGIVIKLQVGNPVMTVNGQAQSIEVAPVIQNGHTLLPVRSIVEVMGGAMEWEGTASAAETATVTYGNNVVRFTIDNPTAYLNDNPITLDTAPAIIGSRIMLPIRFIAETFGFDIAWDASDATITVTGSTNVSSLNKLQWSPVSNVASDVVPPVYMTTEISPESLMAIYDALDREATGNVAVKISTGEPGGNNFLSPDLIKDLVQSVDGTLVECNTAYGGKRISTAMHYQAAEDHGYTAIAPVVIMDEEAEMSLPVTNGKHLTEDIVGARFAEFDFQIVLSHFKGHGMAGFGGALKNLSIGYGSTAGKCLIHTAGASRTTMRAGEQDPFLESMAEAAKAVVDASGDKILYINVMNNLSVDCDCSANPADPEMGDIGILASLDPVALDKACVDLVYAAHDGHALIERIESRNGTLILDHAADIGLGSMKYELISIDD